MKRKVVSCRLSVVSRIFTSTFYILHSAFCIFLLPVSCLLLPLSSSAQSSAKWEQIYGGGGNEYGYRVRSCMDQGYIVCGSSSSNGLSDGYIVRTDSLGLVMWEKSYGGNNIDVMRSIKQLPDSGYIVAGYSNSTGHGGYDGWVLRLNKIGDTLWTKYYGTTDWDFFYDVAPTYDGGFVLAGGTYGQGAGDEDMWFLKIDSAGNIIWNKTQGGTKQDEARGIVETGDSMIAACGFTYSLGDTLGDSWIMRLDKWNGDTVWTRTINQPTFEDKGWGLADLYSFNRIMIVGESSALNGDPDGYVQAMTYGGASVFNLDFGGAGSVDNFTGIVTRPNATFACLGTTENNAGNGHGDLWFFHDRTSFTSSIIGTLSQDAGYSIDLAHDDGYIACGFTEGFNSILPDLYLVKIDTNGLSTGITGIREQPAPLSFGSASVFPNPVQDEATISFDATENISGKLSVDIYDLEGRKIETNFSSQWEIISSRNASCKINTSMLSDGIYQFVISDSDGGKAPGRLIVSH